MNLLHVTDYSDVANRNLDRVWHYEFPAGTEATDVEACQGYVAVGVDDLNNYADGKVYIFTAYDGNQMTLLHTVSSESIKSRSHLHLKNGAEPENRPSKHETSSQCWFNVGPASQTVDQHKTKIGSMSHLCWSTDPNTFHRGPSYVQTSLGLVQKFTRFGPQVWEQSRRHQKINPRNLYGLFVINALSTDQRLQE